MNTGIEYLEIFAQGMFASQMIEFDLKYRAPSIWASEDIGAMMSSMTGDEALAGAYVGAGGTDGGAGGDIAPPSKVSSSP